MGQYADGSVIIAIDADSKAAEQELEKTKDGLEGVGDGASEAQKELGNMSKETDAATAQMMKLSAGAAAVSTALIAVGATAVSAATQFESAFAQTQTIMDQTQMDVGTMREDILALSQESAMAGSDVSEAVYNAISGSVATADAVKFVDQANKLAVAGFTDLANATDVMTTVLNAYGLEASYVGGISNVLIQTQNLGKTTVDALSHSMGRAISTGSAYGVNLQNLSTAYVELTRGGIDTAEATTYLSGMLNELGNAGSVVGRILQDQTGQSFGQLMQQGYSLGDVLKILSDSVDGNSEALMGLWSSQEAGKASNAIMTQGVEDFNDVLRQMNDEMAGISTTTDDAYETMTNTSEFIDKKLSNSLENLAIAAGEHLTPVLNAAKNALTGIVEKATKIVEDSPFLVSVVAGAAVGFGALSLSLAAYVVKARLATNATWKLTTALMSNGFTAIISAILAVVAALATYIAQALDATDTMDRLTEATQRYKEVMETSQSTYDETANRLAGTKELAEQYIGRLQELESQQSMTDAEMNEYSQIVSKLQMILPDINITLDEQTGLLEDGAAALRYLVDNWYELAVAQALQERMTEQIKAQADAEAELFTREQERNKLLAERAVLSDQKAAVDAELEKTTREYQRLTEEYQNAEAAFSSGDMGEDAFLEARNAALAAEAAVDSLTMEQIRYEEEIAAVDGEIMLVDKAIAECNETLAANEQAVQDAVDAHNSYVDGLEEAEDSTTNADSLIYEFGQKIENLATAYELAKDAARASLDDQIGLWQKMDNQAVTSIDNIIGALDSQITYLENYSSNLATAATLGVSEEILQALSDGSEESAAILAGLVDASEEEINELNEKWSKVSAGKDNLAEGMAEYDDTVIACGDELISLAAQVGLDMSNAMTAGLLEGLPLFEQAVYQFTPNTGDSPIDGGQRGNSIPAYASGTASAAAGVAIVGENGPELVYFNGGERVLSAEETRDALRTVYPSAPEMGHIGVGAPAIAGRGSLQLRATIAVPVNVDGREIARATAEYMGEEMEFEVM